jgi:adenine-specific DNA-methyltransferase
MKKMAATDPLAQSADLSADHAEQLKNLFPEAFTEGKVDFEALRQLLGDAADGREEKFGLSWHGKRQARQLALSPSTGTLRPYINESLNWDTTRNLFIEGDNLEALKLMQKSYSAKIKLIYIDPPYNTGNDFVYADDYRDNIKNYLKLTAQLDDSGAKWSSNTDSSGRFHTDWLNMMYPRLRLARTLLSEDGAIFVSIDDGELSSLVAMLSEIFGNENQVAIFVWEKRTTRENRRVFSFNHEYVVCFTRNKPAFESIRNLLPTTNEVRERYRNPDNDPRGPWQSVSLNAQGGHATKDQFYSYRSPGGRVHNPPPGRCWVVAQKRMDELVADNRVWFGEDGNNVPRRKMFLAEATEGLTPHTLWRADEVGTNDSARKDLISLFDGVDVFDTPKPVGLIRRVVEIVTTKDDLVLDFFAGAGTTAEAVAEANAGDGGTRACILVQIPEPSALGKVVGLPTLADVAKERWRRIRQKHTDVGFRVFKLAESNVATWNPGRADLGDLLARFTDNIVAGRSEDDLLFELILKFGLELTTPLEAKKIAGNTVHSIGGGVLMACLAPKLKAPEIEALGLGIVAWRRALAPTGETTAVFRDSAFQDDVAKTNLTAILEQTGVKDVRSL